MTEPIAHTYAPMGPQQREACLRSAALAAGRTTARQAVHSHSSGRGCLRGEGCVYVEADGSTVEIFPKDPS